MQDDQPISAEIADEAARWFADRDSGLDVDEAAFAAWLHADPKHRRAYTEITAIWADLANVRPSASPIVGQSERRRRNRPWRTDKTRRRLPIAIAAGIVLAIVAGVQDWPTWLRADAMTGVGERRIVTLADGSRLHLNTDSAIAVDMRANARIVTLLKGEASFSVAPDPARPFKVEAAGGTTTALGTRFIVRMEPEGARVTVTQHQVKVDYAQGDGLHQQRLAEGQSLMYDGDHGLGRPARVNGADAEAWTQGMLVFENQPLGQVISELARYHSGYVRLIGSEAQNRRVSGVFRIDDPVAALDKLQHALRMRSVRVTDRLILLYD